MAALIFIGVADFSSANGVFVGLSMLGRFCEGLGMALLYGALFQMIPSYYSSFASYFTAFQLGICLADLVGPLWSLLYASIGYSSIFFLQSISTFFCIIIVLLFLDH